MLAGLYEMVRYKTLQRALIVALGADATQKTVGKDMPMPLDIEIAARPHELPQLERFEKIL